MSKNILVISDTHWSSWEPDEPSCRALGDVLESGTYEFIFHGGDVVDDSVLKVLEGFAPIYCVKGNCDSFVGRNLPHTVVETIENVKIAMIHGWDLPLDHTPTLVERFGGDTDIIIHGHTHRKRYQEWTRPDGSKVTILNPGSVSSPRGGEMAGYGELTLTDGEWAYKIRNF